MIGAALTVNYYGACARCTHGNDQGTACRHPAVTSACAAEEVPVSEARHATRALCGVDARWHQYRAPTHVGLPLLV